jgi:hypothetical protein
MTPLIYNLSMLAGLALASAGAGIVGGVGVGLLTAGGLLLACTAFTAVMVR